VGPEKVNKAAEGTGVLEKHTVHLREELDWEQEERNYFQLEHDMMHTLWEITRRQLEEKRVELCNEDREMEEQHQVEVRVYKQKVKHLLYKHQENLTELEGEGILSVKLAQEMELQKDKCSLKVKLVRNEQEITWLCNDSERQVRTCIKARYAEKMQVQIHDVEERKNSHISELMMNHKKAFSDMKNYWHSCSQEQEQIKDLQKRVNHLEKKADVLLQNKQLKESLHQAQEQVFKLQKLVCYDKDKEALMVSGQPCLFPSHPGPPGGSHSAVTSATWLGQVAEQSEWVPFSLARCL
uniref:Dynein regulatory complex subunit 4 n=1 Tax=Amazona collaria TaxID=241587 RepID=A0A8B9G9C4_9PSIT